LEQAGTLILIGLVFSTAALVQGLTGFGFSLLSVGILAAVLGPRVAIPLNIVAAFVNCLFLAILLRRAIMFRAVWGLLVVAVLVVPLGVLFLQNFDRAIIIRGIGVVILFVSISFLVTGRRSRVFGSKPFKWLAGAGMGLLGGAFYIPGPLVVLYAYNSDWPVRAAMANLQFMFSVIAVVTVSSYYLTGLLTAEAVGWGLAYAPLVILFTLLGSMVSRRLHTRHLSVVINVFLVILGITLLVRG